jgi:hypothetical protein
MTEATHTTEPDELHGWKQIAAHVGVHRDTAAKFAQWGAEARMPVFRSRITGHVIARRSELDRWKRDQIAPVGAEPWGKVSKIAARSGALRRGVRKQAKSKRVRG